MPLADFSCNDYDGEQIEHEDDWFLIDDYIQIKSKMLFATLSSAS